MSSAAGEGEQTIDRLERFRALRARLDPAGDPARALAEGAYVEQGRSVGARIAAELMVSPSSTHLLIGGVGSGKVDLGTASIRRSSPSCATGPRRDVNAAPTSVAEPEFALRILATRGAEAYFAYLVQGDEVAEVIGEIVAELRAFDERAAVRIVEASSAAGLLQELPSITEEVVLIAAQSYAEADWRRLDRRRSSLGRAGVMVFFTTPSSFEDLMRAAPNLASWLGGFVFARKDESARVAEQREQRLAALRAWSGKTDDEVIQAAERGDMRRDPEYAEWIVLLGRGDLLDV